MNLFRSTGFTHRTTSKRVTSYVVNLSGCPQANVMGHCHVQHLGGAFAGLVCTNSLQVLTAAERKQVRKATTAAKHRIPSERFNITYGEGVER